MSTNEEETRRTFDHALTRWRDTRNPVLARFVLRLGRALEDDTHRKLRSLSLVKQSKWMHLARTSPAPQRDALLATLIRCAPKHRVARIAQLERFGDDPRVTDYCLHWFTVFPERTAPWIPTYRALAAQLQRIGDPRSAALTIPRARLRSPPFRAFLEEIIPTLRRYAPEGIEIGAEERMDLAIAVDALCGETRRPVLSSSPAPRVTANASHHRDQSLTAGLVRDVQVAGDVTATLFSPTALKVTRGSGEQQRTIHVTSADRFSLAEDGTTLSTIGIDPERGTVEMTVWSLRAEPEVLAHSSAHLSNDRVEFYSVATAALTDRAVFAHRSSFPRPDDTQEAPQHYPAYIVELAAGSESVHEIPVLGIGNATQMVAQKGGLDREEVVAIMLPAQLVLLGEGALRNIRTMRGGGALVDVLGPDRYLITSFGDACAATIVDAQSGAVRTHLVPHGTFAGALASGGEVVTLQRLEGQLVVRDESARTLLSVQVPEEIHRVQLHRAHWFVPGRPEMCVQISRDHEATSRLQDIIAPRVDLLVAQDDGFAAALGTEVMIERALARDRPERRGLHLEDPVTALAITADRVLAVRKKKPGAISIYSRGHREVFTSHRAPIAALVVDRTRKSVIAGHRDGVIATYDQSDVAEHIFATGEPLGALVLAARDSVLVGAGERLRWWSLAGEELGAVPRAFDRLAALAGRATVLASDREGLFVIDLKTRAGKRLGEEITALATHKSGLVAFARGAVVTLANLIDGELETCVTLTDAAGAVHALAFTEHELIVGTAGSSGGTLSRYRLALAQT